MKCLFVAILLAGLATAANASADSRGDLKIEHPWLRATPKGAKTAAGYLTVINGGGNADRLLGATMTAAEPAQVHQMTSDDGVMKMRAVIGGLEIKPGETVELKPNSLHLMFTGLGQPLIKGQSVKVSLKFEHAGTLDVEFPVEELGTRAEKTQHMRMDNVH